MWAKFAVQTLVAFVLMLGIYELLIRPFNPMRALFGVRANPRTAVGARSKAGAAA